jgi:glutathione S-transferase
MDPSLLTGWWQQGKGTPERISKEPQMITLYAFGPAFGLPDASPSVMKTEVHLMMAGLDYLKDPTGFARTTEAKLPTIEDSGTVVSDSTLIRLHLEQTYGVDLDHGLTARQRAEAWAIERMLEDHLGWASAYFLWAVPENFERGPARLFDRAPVSVRAGLRRHVQEQVTAGIYAHGMGRLSTEEIAQLGATSIWALDALLDGKPFLLGAEPTAVDATAFSLLAHVMAPLFDTPLREVVEGTSHLTDYVERTLRLFYPAHGRTDDHHGKHPVWGRAEPIAPVSIWAA